ncbi:uncharacterized protein DDB_G0283697-like [Colias croceus]|uniref:uncharacterized protein DDB_G0283697-like n=1 Tax=Colias crocea TaxID=72248 RepID=UPI001E27B044|nr:uncharacterized protein DDB_G0283697-like [Colias croceus]
MSKAKFFIYGGGRWRELDDTGRVSGWAGARFVYLKRGKLCVANRKAVVRGLNRLAAGKPSSVKVGLPVPQIRNEDLKTTKDEDFRKISEACHCCMHKSAKCCEMDANFNKLLKPMTHSIAVQCNPMIEIATQAPSQNIHIDKPQEIIINSPTTSKGLSQSTQAKQNVCKELLIDETDVELFRNFVLNDPHNVFNVDLLLYDENDDYKRQVFYKINPLVNVERNRRIQRIVDANSKIQKKHFTKVLGLRSVNEPVNYRYSKRRRTENKENMKQVDSVNDKIVVSDSEKDSASVGKVKEVLNSVNKDSEGSLKVKEVLNSANKDSEGSPKVRKKVVKKWSGKSPSVREYSRLEDDAIVTWIVKNEKENLVNGNRIWQIMQPVHHQNTGHFRSWHSLRNRYLRYILPSLGMMAIPPAVVSSLRAAASAGEIKGRKESRRNSIFKTSRVRSAWTAKPKEKPQSEEEPSTSRHLRSNTLISPPGNKLPTYSEITRRFAMRHRSTPNSTESDKQTNNTKHDGKVNAKLDHHNQQEKTDKIDRQADKADRHTDKSDQHSEKIGRQTEKNYRRTDKVDRQSDKTDRHTEKRKNKQRTTIDDYDSESDVFKKSRHVVRHSRHARDIRRSSRRLSKSSSDEEVDKSNSRTKNKEDRPSRNITNEHKKDKTLNRDRSKDNANSNYKKDKDRSNRKKRSNESKKEKKEANIMIKDSDADSVRNSLRKQIINNLLTDNNIKKNIESQSTSTTQQFKETKKDKNSRKHNERDQNTNLQDENIVNKASERVWKKLRRSVNGQFLKLSKVDKNSLNETESGDNEHEISENTKVKSHKRDSRKIRDSSSENERSITRSQSTRVDEKRKTKSKYRQTASRRSSRHSAPVKNTEIPEQDTSQLRSEKHKEKSNSSKRESSTKENQKNNKQKLKIKTKNQPSIRPTRFQNDSKEKLNKNRTRESSEDESNDRQTDRQIDRQAKRAQTKRSISISSSDSDRHTKDIDKETQSSISEETTKIKENHVNKSRKARKHSTDTDRQSDRQAKKPRIEYEIQISDESSDFIKDPVLQKRKSLERTHKTRSFNRLKFEEDSSSSVESVILNRPTDRQTRSKVADKTDRQKRTRRLYNPNAPI